MTSVSVHCRKKCVILDYGGAPFKVNKHGCVIPHGFKVKSYFWGNSWIVEIRVNDSGYREEYKWRMENQEMEGEWCNTLCKGYRSGLKAAGMDDIPVKDGRTGKKILVRRPSLAIVAGVTYPEVQREIRNKHHQGVGWPLYCKSK